MAYVTILSRVSERLLFNAKLTLCSYIMARISYIRYDDHDDPTRD